MDRKSRVVVSALFVLLIPTLSAQPADIIERDQQAIAVLTQSVDTQRTAGTPQLLDFVATGEITYYAAGRELHGAVTIRGAGKDNLRLDATLESGVRSWAFKGFRGVTKSEAGKMEEIPLHSLANIRAALFFLPRLSHAVSDPSTSISYRELETSEAGQLHRIRLESGFPSEMDPDGLLRRLGAEEVFIDPTTSLVVKSTGTIAAKNNANDVLLHSFHYANYQHVSGILFPFEIVEEIAGQRVARIELDSIRLNTGLSDSDFDLQ